MYPGDPGLSLPWLLAGTCFLGSVRNKPSKTYLVFFNGLRVGTVAASLATYFTETRGRLLETRVLSRSTGPSS